MEGRFEVNVQMEVEMEEVSGGDGGGIAKMRRKEIDLLKPESCEARQGGAGRGETTSDDTSENRLIETKQYEARRS